MSEPVRIVNSVTDCDDSQPESRPVLGPAGNKTRSVAELRKPVAKPKAKVGKPVEVRKSLSPVTVTSPGTVTVNLPMHCKQMSPIMRHKDCKVLKSNVAMNASCSSDASSDSSQRSHASVGRVSRRSATPVRGKQSGVLKSEKVESVLKKGKVESVERGEKVENAAESNGCLEVSADGLFGRKRCAWVTANTDPCYAAFHDEEWGVQVHDDKKLFELLSLSTALAELTWPAIINKRHLFREVFHGFDPITVSKLNDKKVSAPGSPATSLLSEMKLRGITENARQVCKIANEFGSFDKYIWGFVNHKPIVNKFRYPRQIPIKTSKADSISKDLIRRGFRGVGPTVIYSFLQVAGLTNDHLVGCFRFSECIDAGPIKDILDDSGQNSRSENGNGLGLTSVIDKLCLSGD